MVQDFSETNFLVLSRVCRRFLCEKAFAKPQKSSNQKTDNQKKYCASNPLQS
jgi:hypothetical protein